MLEKLFEIQKMLLDQFVSNHFFYDRFLFNKIAFDNKIIGIVGARGVGKTTFLLKKVFDLNKETLSALYVSADNIFFLDHKLLDVVDVLYKETDVRLLCVDEVHKYLNWAQELKNIVDSYPGFQVLFSGSSAIDIIHSKYDLSRRVSLYELHGFSFREYVEITYQKSLPKVGLHELVQSHHDIAHELPAEVLKYFKEYLRVGYYPFFHGLTQEMDKFQAIENVTQKTVYEDIATLYSLKTPTLLVIERLYKYILQSAPGEISAYKLASLLAKDFESVSEYIRYLQLSGLIRCLYPNKVGNAFLRNPAKIYPENTNMMYAHFVPQLIEATTGKVRETFAISHLQNAGYRVYYSDVADFTVDHYLFEVGGKNKTTQQIKNEQNTYVLADGIIMGGGRRIPLCLLGLLY